MASKKKLQRRTTTRRATPTKGTSSTKATPTRTTSIKATTPSAKRDDSSQAEFELLCREIVAETSVVARADRVMAARAIYWKSPPAAQKSRGDAMVASFFPAICRLTGLSKRQVQYDLEIAKIHRSAKQLLVGKPLANRTLLLLDLAKVGDWRQQVNLARMSGDLRKFTKALAEVVSKEVKAKPPIKPTQLPIDFDEPMEVLLANRLFQVTLTRVADGMRLTINPKVEASDTTSKQKADAPLVDVKDVKDVKDTKDVKDVKDTKDTKDTKDVKSDAKGKVGEVASLEIPAGPSVSKTLLKGSNGKDPPTLETEQVLIGRKSSPVPVVTRERMSPTMRAWTRQKSIV